MIAEVLAVGCSALHKCGDLATKEGGLSVRTAHTMASIMATTLLLGLLLPATGDAKVGNNSCAGDNACTSNTGDVKQNACNGELACLHNTGTVGDHACVGVMACYNNSGHIGPGQCIGDRVCENNQADIP